MLVMTTDDTQLYIWNKEDLKQIKYLLSREAYNITTAKIYEAYNQYATECYERDEKLNLMVKKKIGRRILHRNTHTPRNKREWKLRQFHIILIQKKQ